MRSKWKCGGQCLGESIKEKGLTFLIPFLVGWNVGKMARAEAATLDYEAGSAANSRNLVLKDCASCHTSLGPSAITNFFYMREKQITII